MKKVYKDKKNNQRRLVYKVWGECCFQPAFVEALRGILGHYNARVEVIDRDPDERPEERNWVLASLNVSSIRRESRRSVVVETAGERMTLIQDYIMRHNIDFFALQETGRTVELPGWELHDYYLVERTPSRLEKGIRGIGMLVKKNLQPYVLPKSTYTDLWVQVNTGCGVMHVVSVYLPNKNMSQVENVREELTKKIQSHNAEFPSTPLILMGDFNLHPKQMEKWVSTLGREMVLAKQATPCNTYPKDGTTLDYVVYRRIPGFRCESVVVDTQNEISDHRIKTAVRISVVKQIGGERESRSMDGVDPGRSAPATDASPTGEPAANGEGNTPATNEGETHPAENPENPEEDDIWNSPIDWYKIQTVLEEMKNGKSAGLDGIPALFRNRDAETENGPSSIKTPLTKQQQG